MSFEIAIPNECNDLEAVVKGCSLSAVSEHGQFKKAFMMAAGVNRLREMITPAMLGQIMPLMNTALGFRTDRDPANCDRDGKKMVPYHESVVKECLIEAVLRGLAPVGNQFNIISGRCYTTKEGFSALLKTLPGLSDLKITLGVPKTMGDKGAIVQASATWKMNGSPDKIEREIPVKINAMMGSDGALGKAERKIKALIYGQITGTVLSDGEVDSGDDAIPTTSKPTEDPNEKLKNIPVEPGKPAKPIEGDF